MARKSIFITGAGSGIGRATAQKFAREGWFVGVSDIDESGIAGTLALLPADTAWSGRLDVRDRAAWDTALTDFAGAAGGAINVVFNNAGVPWGGGEFAQNVQRDIDAVIDINFRGVVYGAHAAYPWLKAAAPNACLLNTASAAAIYGAAGLAVYSATKFAVRAMTEALDNEWAPDGIRVRDLMPGFIDTPLLDLPGGANSNRSIRQTVSDGGLEVSPVTAVSDAAWDAVHGKRLHTTVGKMAKQLAFAVKWMPWTVRKRYRALIEAGRAAES